MSAWTSSAIRLLVFLAVLVVLLVLEACVRGTNPSPRRRQRWLPNAAMVLFGTLLVRLLLPAGATGAALWAQSYGIGLLNFLDWSEWVELVLALVLLDLAIYWQHRLLHAIPLLWRLHRVHTDLTLDATSALRFHPLEILLSLLFKMALAVILGVAPLAVLIFEVVLSSLALITHADLTLPPRMDRAVRAVLVTPAMHRIHHSTLGDEQRRNFGFNLSCWDYLFSSYAAQARHQPQDFGLISVRGNEATRLLALLREPFVRRDSQGEPSAL